MEREIQRREGRGEEEEEGEEGEIEGKKWEREREGRVERRHNVF